LNEAPHLPDATWRRGGIAARGARAAADAAGHWASIFRITLAKAKAVRRSSAFFANRFVADTVTLHISREKDEEIALVAIMAVRAEGRATNSISLCAKEEPAQ
jgi:hypothetical protein